MSLVWMNRLVGLAFAALNTSFRASAEHLKLQQVSPAPVLYGKPNGGHISYSYEKYSEIFTGRNPIC